MRETRRRITRFFHRHNQFFKYTLCVSVIGLMLAGCQQHTASQTPIPTPTQTLLPSATPSPAAQAPLASIQPTVEQVIAPPTPAPTATPSPFDITVDTIVNRVGARNLTVLGLNGVDLINLLISLLIPLAGSLVGSLIVDGALWITTKTPTKADHQVGELVARPVKWLIFLILLQIATVRLAFLSAEFKQWLVLIYFALFVLVVGDIFWQLIDFVLEGPLRRSSSLMNRGLLVTFTPLLRRTIQLLIILIGLAVVLKNFGVNLSALLAVLGLGGLAVSLAAQETLEDMINGFIILIDRPFQIGDRIKIQTMDTWGDVVDIGSRTTRIRTLDNRLVIVPNSIIGRNQIENYTYTDPSTMVITTIGVAYGSDIDQVLDLIEKTVSSVPDILHTKPPLVEFYEFGDSAIIMRVIYWLKSYDDFLVKTQVNKAIYQALTEANIEIPFATYDINLAYKNKPENRNDSET